MKSFKNKVAVITGAASGIGFGLAEKCLKEEMKVVLADVESSKLKEAEDLLLKHGEQILTIKTDVSKLSDIENLAKKTFNNFSEVHLLFNNAGIGIAGPSSWEYSLKDWQWVLGVNLWSVIYGINVFLPLMLKQYSEGHIINTASASGLLSMPSMAPYNVSKHSIVTLSETMYSELKNLKANVNVSVLCPGLVNTNIMSAERNRPEQLQNDTNLTLQREKKHGKFITAMEHGIKKGLTIEQIAETVFEAIKKERFYIIPHDWTKEQIKERMKSIITGTNPFDSY
ncbi:MAG: 1-deoxy-11-beta-hydroxypentalenate dehydrogenase [Candidatus Heimdallarchaeota archaeon LC_3]|nr:MAG: 1-deoxy-11-beta-hydroxypentalenate dehydrogenase [Candidatus Heimdallarchaeota archaeon LC_3]